MLTRFDTEAMNLFLAELSQAVAPGAHAVVLTDKAGWHTAGDLVVPENLSLVFLPPYLASQHQLRWVSFDPPPWVDRRVPRSALMRLPPSLFRHQLRGQND